MRLVQAWIQDLMVLGWSHGDIAARLGYEKSQTTIHDLYHGKYTDTSWQTVYKIMTLHKKVHSRREHELKQRAAALQAHREGVASKKKAKANSAAA